MTIVFVADMERSKNARPQGVWVDAGTMGQSCYLAATALGVAGCVRASFDHDALRDAMKLPICRMPAFPRCVRNCIPTI